MRRNRTPALILLSAMLTAAAQRTQAALASGMLLTNFVSATFSFPNGLSSNVSLPGLYANGSPRSATTRTLVTDQPSLCMRTWKTARDTAGTPLAGLYAGSAVTYEVSFSNCGSASAFSVKITDILPAGVMRGDTVADSLWIGGGGSAVFVGWATSISGPWLETPPAGQPGPHYARWILDHVGQHRTGFVRYVVTIL